MNLKNDKDYVQFYTKLLEQMKSNGMSKLQVCAWKAIYENDESMLDAYDELVYAKSKKKKKSYDISFNSLT